MCKLLQPVKLLIGFKIFIPYVDINFMMIVPAFFGFIDI